MERYIIPIGLAVAEILSGATAASANTVSVSGESVPIPLEAVDDGNSLTVKYWGDNGWNVEISCPYSVTPGPVKTLAGVPGPIFEAQTDEFGNVTGGNLTAAESPQGRGIYIVDWGKPLDSCSINAAENAIPTEETTIVEFGRE